MLGSHSISYTSGSGRSEILYGTKERKDRLHCKTACENAADLPERQDENQEREEMMFGKIQKYAPAAALIGYAAVYGSKGWQYVTSDLKAFATDPIAKIEAKWQNWAIAIALGIGLAILKKVKLPKEIKAVLTILIWLLIGWQIALAIDPPGYTNGNGASVSATRNRYANGGA